MDREEKDMYKRMVDGGADKETKKTPAKTATVSRRQDRWVSDGLGKYGSLRNINWCVHFSRCDVLCCCQ